MFVDVRQLIAPAAWSAWVPLGGIAMAAGSPALPGLYRIRRVGFDGLDYVGQTGTGSMTLRKRLGMLRGVYGVVMPYNDPHTAGPGLWALRHAGSPDFEVSTCAIAGDAPWRKALECCVISLYREERRTSPTLNFGRMPVGYRKSSGNNRRLAEAGRRFRGGLVEVTDDPVEGGSIPPVGSLDGDSQAGDFGGHAWSPWQSILESIADAGTRVGLYRIRRPTTDELVYIGQGGVASRLGAHLAKAVATHRQAEAFSGALEASFVGGSWTLAQRLELENDLIAGHMLHYGAPPPAQFLG